MKPREGEFVLAAGIVVAAVAAAVDFVTKEEPVAAATPSPSRDCSGPAVPAAAVAVTGTALLMQTVPIAAGPGIAVKSVVFAAVAAAPYSKRH